jgi:regulator of sirC expression with transglutaminase-like and TPR domain
MTRRWYRCGTLLIVLLGTVMPLREGQARLPRAWFEASLVSGTVQSTSADKLVLTTDEGLSRAHQGAGRQTFVLTSGTQLLWGTKRLAVEDLRRGDVVMVRFHEGSGVKVAEAVWALMARARELSPAQTAEAEAEAAYARANRLLETAHVREALPYLDRAIHLHPGFLRAHSRRGFVYATLAALEEDHAAKLRARERALADYTTAIDEGSKHGFIAATWYNNRGVLYRQLQDLDHALHDFTAAIRVDPTYVLALHNRAQLRRALGDPQGAMADLTQVIDLEPEVGKWYCQRGALWQRQEAITQAQQDFQRCLTLDPSLREQYPEALEVLHRAPHS